MAQAIRDYRDIVAWQRAQDFAVMIATISDSLPRREWELASQMRRAANSVHSNIAEGNGRGTIRDYLRHLYISRASLNEIESDLHYLGRRYGDRFGVKPALDLGLTVRRPLAGLIRSLEAKREGDR